ncbi:MAG: pseudouridine-5'-phosphate glycosidase [Pseudomonadota bacterium]
MSLPLVLTDEIRAAQRAGRPIVALESTIITHGMPTPENLATARAVEADVRAEGAVPATIAVLAGAIHVGLNADALAGLAATKDVKKLSRADLAQAIVCRATGSTTVAATMICAHLAGIGVFATGGIGGVHRGAEYSFDVSADLQELARTPVTVVSAGAKAILDLPKTLEMLETLGVPVCGYRTAELPAFWSRDSGLAVPLRADSADAIAAMQKMRCRLGLSGGLLVVNPIPAGAEIPAAEIAPVIDAAIAEAKAAGISGKAVTPYLLARIGAATQGRALAANIALVRENARLAAALARAMQAA